jgi:hypothetical protein
MECVCLKVSLSKKLHMSGLRVSSEELKIYLKSFIKYGMMVEQRIGEMVSYPPCTRSLRINTLTKMDGIGDTRWSPNPLWSANPCVPPNCLNFLRYLPTDARDAFEPCMCKVGESKGQPIP